MLLQNSACLENVIVQLLSESPLGLTAQQILEQVSRRFQRYSRRGIYRELQRLISEGILIRARSQYVLRLAWLLSLHSQLEQLYAQVRNPEFLRFSLPSRDTPVLIQCGDLVGWDRVWTQMMLVMHSLFPQLPMFIWCPRHWFTITHPEIENIFAMANQTQGHLRFALVGGRSSLDLHDRGILAQKSTAFSFRESAFEDDRNHYYWIIGDYFGVSTLDRRTARRIDEFYLRNGSLKKPPQDAKSYLLSQKIKGSVRCDWAPEKAERLRRKFLTYFPMCLKPDGTMESHCRGEI